MSQTAEVVVVGGGIAGVSIAYYLTERGVSDVLVLERDGLASGATGASAAFIRMHYANPWDASLALRSYEIFKDWAERIGGQCSFRRTGFLMIAPPEDADNVRANVKMLQDLGVKTEALSPEDVKIVQPFLNVEDLGAAAYEPDSGFADGSDTVNSLVEAARARGVTVRQRVEVEEIRTEGDVVKGVTLKGGEEIDSPNVVLAAGAWSKRLGLTAGVEIPIVARTIFAGVLQRPPSLPGPMVVIDRTQHTYFRQDTPDLTLFGLEAIDAKRQEADAPGDCPTVLSHEDVAYSVDKMSHRMPAMAEATLRRTWMAQDGFSPDGHCILDRSSDVEGLYIAVGFSGTGFKVGPAVGMCMAELITEGKARTVNIAPFRMSRFEEGKPVYGPYEYGAGRMGRGWLA